MISHFLVETKLLLGNHLGTAVLNTGEKHCPNQGNILQPSLVARERKP